MFGVQVMQTLKDLAKEGCTVVCSIHQPRSSIFAMFDDLLILSEGKLLYEGSAEASLKFFEAQASGDPCHCCVPDGNAHSSFICRPCKASQQGPSPLASDRSSWPRRGTTFLSTTILLNSSLT